MKTSESVHVWPTARHAECCRPCFSWEAAGVPRPAEFVVVIIVATCCVVQSASALHYCRLLDHSSICMCIWILGVFPALRSLHVPLSSLPVDTDSTVPHLASHRARVEFLPRSSLELWATLARIFLLCALFAWLLLFRKFGMY